MTHTRTAPLWLALWLTLASSPTSAHAQDDLEQLKAQFREGLKLEEEDKWREARDLFSAIAEKKRSPAVVFHIALCDEQLGKLASALRGFEEAVELGKADPKTPPEVLENAPKRAEALRARVPVIVLVQEEGSRRAFVDGEPVDGKAGEIERFVDLGTHEVQVEGDDGERVKLRTVDVIEGARVRVKIPKKKAKTEVVEPKLPLVSSEPEPGNKIPGFVVGGVGVGALIAAGAFIGLREVAISEVRASCQGPEPDTGCDPNLRDVADRGRTFEYAAIGLGAAGAAALGVGITLLLTVGQDRTVTKPAPAISLRLLPLGVGLSGTFR